MWYVSDENPTIAPIDNGWNFNYGPTRFKRRATIGAEIKHCTINNEGGDAGIYVSEEI